METMVEGLQACFSRVEKGREGRKKEGRKEDFTLKKLYYCYFKFFSLFLWLRWVSVAAREVF